MFDVRCSSFKTTPYVINVTCECLQNNLAITGSFTTLPSFEKEGILSSPFDKGGLRPPARRAYGSERGFFASPGLGL